MTETAGPSTPLPRIFCRVWWRWRTPCGFLYGKPLTRPLLVPRFRKSGYAPVWMTNLLCELRTHHTRWFLVDSAADLGVPHPPGFPVRFAGSTDLLRSRLAGTATHDHGWGRAAGNPGSFAPFAKGGKRRIDAHGFGAPPFPGPSRTQRNALRSPHATPAG